MARKNGEQLYKLGGVPKNSKLTPSKKISGGFSPLVHGKGIKSQAVLIPVRSAGQRRSVLGFLLAFAAKALLVVLVGCAVIAAGAVLVSAVIDGVTAGLTDVAGAVSAASEYLVLGAGIAAAIAVAAVGLKIARSVARGRARASERAEARRAAAAEAGSYFQRSRTMQAASAQQSTWTQPVAPVTTRSGAARPDWYPDPSNAAQLCYWNGEAWTDHVRPRHTTAAAPAGWYADALNAAQLRYWNGTMWTDHFAPRGGVSLAGRPTTTPWSDMARDSTGDEPRITMSNAEWQAHVRAWMAAGAVEQELWRRLSNAQISDADRLTLEAQRRMEKLTAEQAAQRIRLMLEANPGMGQDLGLAEFLTRFLTNLTPLDRSAPVSIAEEPRRPR